MTYETEQPEHLVFDKGSPRVDRGHFRLRSSEGAATFLVQGPDREGEKSR